jgi:hypothetical protein
MQTKIFATWTFALLLALILCAVPEIGYAQAGGTLPPPDSLPTTGAELAGVAQSISAVAALISALGAGVWVSRRRFS